MGGAAGRGQAVQVGHDDHGRLAQVDGQLVVLGQRQVAQEALVGAQRRRQDLRVGPGRVWVRPPPPGSIQEGHRTAPLTLLTQLVWLKRSHGMPPGVKCD